MNDQIAKIAYQKWQKADYPQGKDEDFWLEAEKEVREDEKLGNEIRLLWENAKELKEKKLKAIWELAKTFQ